MITVETMYPKVEYKDVRKKISELIAGDPKKGTSDYDEFDMIGTLASAYEDIHYPIKYQSIVGAEYSR